MSEPKRFRESGSPRLRALVEAGKRDRPGERLDATVLGALGLGAAGGAALAAGGSAPGLARSAMTRFFDALRHVVFSKIGIGLIAATTAGGAGYFAGRAHERTVQHRGAVAGTVAASGSLPSRAPPDPGTASAASLALASNPSAASSVVGSVPTATSIPSEHDSPPPLTAKGRTTSPVVAMDGRVGVQPRAKPQGEGTPPSIAMELEAIRRAHAFVEAGDARAALAELDAYEKRSPNGTFEEEVIALRVQALRLAGDAAGASRELADLQSRFPRSVHLARLAR